MTRSQFEALRTRYDFRCGYCKTGESEAGSLLTVDHFCPRSRGGKDEESNWVYCCFACNSFKAAFCWPESITAYSRLLDPR